MEEELFGRTDLDNTYGHVRAISPMHPRRMSEPMKWLDVEPGGLHLELTGIGLNLVSGNFEFACLATIDNPDFWPNFAGHIESSWETKGLRIFEYRDIDVSKDFLMDANWNIEGLFSLASSNLLETPKGHYN